MSSKWWLVCYDVHDEKRLRTCAKHMEGYGERIQHSVFRCWLTQSELERLRWELTEKLDPDDDVIFIPLCSNCVRSISGIHYATRPIDWPEQPERHRIV
jgi:CRISPR-associated protein Cas2